MVSAQPEYFFILMTLTALVGLVGRAARSCALPSASRQYSFGGAFMDFHDTPNA